MASLVPPASGAEGQNEQARGLADALDALMEFIGASAGWIGLREASGRLTFPVCRGGCAEEWLRLQQGMGGVWGFEVRDGPVLVNDLRPLVGLVAPPLVNLLSCPLGPSLGAQAAAASAPEQVTARGYVVLANKPAGFTAPDAAVLQGAAHLMYRLLLRQETLPPIAPLWRTILDRSGDGILLVDEQGVLLHANTVWLDWTGFSAEDVLGRPAPFPFWISPQDLATSPRLSRPAADGGPEAGRAAPVPFRRRNHSLFWCDVETTAQDWEGRRVLVGFLRPTGSPDERSKVTLADKAAPPAARETSPAASPEQPLQTGAAMAAGLSLVALAADLPFAMALSDGQGRLRWANGALARLAPGAAPGRTLSELFPPGVAGPIGRLLREPGNSEPGRMGCLFLPGEAVRQGPSTSPPPQTIFWLTLRLVDGPGLLLVIADSAEGFALTGEAYSESRLPASLPSPDWLALLLEPGAPVRLWDQRWEQLTGVPAADLAGQSTELVLDWLFPRQSDRERVADALQQGEPRGWQAVLPVLTRTGEQPLLCTFLPIPGPEQEAGEQTRARPPRWLFLAGQPQLCAVPDSPSLAFVRQFTRGLGHLLRHYLRVPLGLADVALSRPDLPAEMANWFEQIRDSWRGVARLLAELDDLSATDPGPTEVVPLAGFVRAFLDERAVSLASCDLAVELRDPEVPVRINPRLLHAVLGHLLSNAEQALLPEGPRRIEVRVLADEHTARCEVHDTGEGLPPEDWPGPLVPFFSTRGAFARDPVHAAQEATGLGLTVCQHLLALLGGHLELRRSPTGGTIAALVLPRADRPSPELTIPPPPGGLRRDTASQPHGPHPKSDWSPAEERPPADGSANSGA
jgi:PAS domain S-box-containing protein